MARSAAVHSRRALTADRLAALAARVYGSFLPPEQVTSPLHRKETAMLLIREIMYCKPGKVRPMVDKFQKMSKIMEKGGQGKMRVMTDLSAEQYWTIVSEIEVPTLQAFEDMISGKGASEQDMKEYEKIMDGYHDLVERGRREIFKIEG
jgi:hypothetical protein